MPSATSTRGPSPISSAEAGASAIPTAEAITPAFLTEVLRRGGHPHVEVKSVRGEPVGTGQIGLCIRFHMDVEGDASAPRTLVGKFPSADPLSRQTGIQLRNYAREVYFYRELAARVPIATPRCYLADIRGEGPDFVLLLEDMAPARQGDQLAGCSVPVARAALGELVQLHAATWQDERLRGVDLISSPNPETTQQLRGMYAVLLPAFLGRFGKFLEPDERGIIEAVAESQGPPHAYPAEPWSLVHIDYRLDNLLIDEAVNPPRVSVVDWQSFVVGSPLSDVAYFLGASLLPEVRRPVERDLVRAYHDGLVGAGVRAYDFEQCWTDYRRGAFAGFAVTVIASVIVVETERGNEMFTAMARRHARHALDLGSSEFL